MKKQLIFYFLFVVFFAFSQNISSFLEKKQVHLGEENVLIIKINTPDIQPVLAMPQNALLPFHMEEIKDSIVLKPNYYRKIKFSIYELGDFKIPPLEFKVGDSLLKTQQYEIKVVPSVQATEIDDIMNIKNTDLSWGYYWEFYKIYVLGALVLLAIIFLLWKFSTRGKNIKNSMKLARNRFLKQLSDIEKKNYIENENYRSFYVEILDLCRDFIDYEYQIPAKVLFTEDLFLILNRSNKISLQNQRNIEELLQRGDAVKFAVKIPTQEGMKKDLEFMKFFVKNAHIEIEYENLRNYE